MIHADNFSSGVESIRPWAAASARVGDRPVLIIPGLGGSEPEHWQSHWERELLDVERVEQADWDAPVLAVWLAALKNALRRQPGALLVAHSLGCTLVAHLAASDPEAPVGGALLVAPPDLDRVQGAPPAIRSFAPTPRAAMPFPSIVAASRDDAYARFEWARTMASAWAAEVVDLGRRGHVNVAAGVGRWPEGRVLLHRLSLQARPRPTR